jgi:bifunctional non-homologous end joining protein LigD
LAPVSTRARCSTYRQRLNALEIPQSVKTSGSKGFHVVVPIDGTTPMGKVAKFANAVGTLFVRLAPDRLTQQFSKADRSGRIYVDTGRNGDSATFAAADTVRARRGAPVSAPCRWEEIERGDVAPWTFTLRSMPTRIAEVGDVWADIRRRGRSLAGPSEKLRQLTQP